MVSSDDDDDNIDVGDAEVEAGVHEITTYKALTLLDKLVNLKDSTKMKEPSYPQLKIY